MNVPVGSRPPAPAGPRPSGGGLRPLARGLAAATRFLTVIPVGRTGEARVGPGDPGVEPDLQWAAAFFPLVGLLVGAPVALVLASPLPPLVAAGVALAAWIAITGGLHEDGWMDVMDAAFAPVERARRLEILKDPRVGAHGVSGGGALLLVRFGALAVASPVAVLVAPVVGRWAMAVSLAGVRPAGAGGLAAAFSAHPRAGGASLVGATVLVALGFWAGWAPVAGAVGAAMLAAFPGGWFLARRFGGLTGDGHGAVGHLAEVAALVGFVAVAGGGG